MEYVLIGVVVAAALACPVMMCGPMLLRRFGIIKGGNASMDCMGMMAAERKSDGKQMRDLIARRQEIDAEIARVRADLGAAADPSPRESAPRTTNPT